MSIPEGYRLLTSADVGKVFGTDLESVVYLSDSISYPYSFITSPTNFIRLEYIEDPDGAPAGYYYNIYINNDLVGSDLHGFNSDTYTFTENVEITSFNTDSWNNFFYVKDVSDPYNIKLTEPKLTIHCEEQTMKKDIVVQVDVYDGTVEGGEVESGGSTEEETGYTITFEQYSSSGTEWNNSVANIDDITYSTDNGVTWNKFASIPLTLNNIKHFMVRSIVTSEGSKLSYYSVIGIITDGAYGEYQPSFNLSRFDGECTFNIALFNDTRVIIGRSEYYTESMGGGSD